MDEVVISVRNVSKCYHVFESQRSRLLHAIWPKRETGIEEIWALKDINFEIKRGEAVAIIGRNGGGKSTLLEILTGTLTPSTGEVIVKGRVSALLELGSGFNPEYTGRDNVMMNGLLLGLSRQDIMERFAEIEAFAEIGAAIDRQVKTYSSGMVMRLAFAVQVLCDPDILIIDEALSVGDFFFQQKCLSFIRGLRERGTTLLFVSHDMGVVRDLCPRILYLKQGALLFDGLSGDGIPLFFKEQGSPPKILYHKVAQDNNNEDVWAELQSLKKDAIWIREGEVDECQQGILLAIALYDENEQPVSSFRMGAGIRITVAYLHHGSYNNHITVGLTNKYGHLTTATGSAQLNVPPAENITGGSVVFFDLWLNMMLEAGDYMLTVTLGYETGINLGDRLDQVSQLGPVQLVWDYSKDKAMFIGQCALPARATFRKSSYA